METRIRVVITIGNENQFTEITFSDVQEMTRFNGKLKIVDKNFNTGEIDEEILDMENIVEIETKMYNSHWVLKRREVEREE